MDLPVGPHAEVTASLKRLANVLPSFAEVSLSLAAAPPHLGLRDAKFATVILSIYGGSMFELTGVARNIGDLLPEAPLTTMPVTPWSAGSCTAPGPRLRMTRRTSPGSATGWIG